jgi:NTP pyrophosphatase (non-canonical NTP hydrolase)
VFAAVVKKLVDDAHGNSVAKGWWNKPMTDETVPSKISLMHSELSEALEEFRNGKGPDEIYFNPEKPDKPEGFSVELADTIIRIFDLCGKLNIDIYKAIKIKMAYNATRPHRHGGKVV